LTQLQLLPSDQRLNLVRKR